MMHSKFWERLVVLTPARTRKRDDIKLGFILASNHVNMSELRKKGRLAYKWE
jgi:hypothetical protein